ncbi:MAG: Uma2 family endonuclease [Alkalispirochaeta sp.]
MSNASQEHGDDNARRGFSKLDPDFVLPTHATAEDYWSWPEDVRAEVIDGVVYPKYVDEQGMAAAPLNVHQDVVLEFASVILPALRRTECRPYIAPFAVQLDENSTRTVEPDITVICDPAMLRERGCVGGPPWVIEVLSPTTTRTDQVVKRAAYEKAGVEEYWVVDPAGRIVYISVLGTDGVYGGTTIHAAPEVIAPRRFPELTFDLEQIFSVLDRDGESRQRDC